MSSIRKCSIPIGWQVNDYMHTDDDWHYEAQTESSYTDYRNSSISNTELIIKAWFRHIYRTEYTESKVTKKKSNEDAQKKNSWEQQSWSLHARYYIDLD